MKWDNKGRQFDGFSKVWTDVHDYFIWGAAVTGTRFYHKFKERLKIKGFIDRDNEKQGRAIDDCPVYSPAWLKQRTEPFKMIIATSSYKEIAQQLCQDGYMEGKDFCNSKMFNAIFSLYQDEKVCLYRTDLAITNQCTLRCEKCNMLIPYFERPSHQDIEVLKQDIEYYFKWVDYVDMFNILGGEPFLYPDLSALVEYVGENYKDKIGQINIISNGTLKIDDDFLRICKRYKVFIELSDYSNGLPYLKEKMSDAVRRIEDHQVKYVRKSMQEWLDFGFPNADNSNLSTQELIAFFDACNSPFRGLYNKKLYFCHLNTNAVKTGLFADDQNDYFDLSKYDPEKKKQLIEFDLGYNDNGSISFCKKCNGCFSVNNTYVEVAKQMMP